MGVLRCLGRTFGRSRSNTDKGAEEDDEEYDVCEEHGHDWRDPIENGLDSKFAEVRTGYPVEMGIQKAAVPGRFLGIQYLYQDLVVPCRDCSTEKTKKDPIKTRIVFRKDGEVGSISYSQYESRVEQID